MSRLAIIGGGVTGLTAAWNLAKKGYQVDIFESSSELGGLAADFDMRGTKLEKTYHHLFPSDTAAKKLIADLGLTSRLNWYQSSVSIYLNDRFFPFVTPFDLLAFSPLPFMDRLRTGLVSFFLQKSGYRKEFETVSASKWMRRFSGEAAYKAIWEPLLAGKFGGFQDQVCMSWLWSRLYIRSTARKGVFSGEGLGYLDGGIGTLTRALEKALLETKNVFILKNTPVINTRQREEGKGVVIQTDQNVVTYDSVISTISSDSLADIVETAQDYTQKLRSVPYIGAICLVFSSSQNLGNYYWNNINDRSFPFLIFVNHTKFVDKSVYGGRYVYYLGGYFSHTHEFFSISEEELSSRWLQALKRLFPEFNEAEVSDRNVFRLWNAQHVAVLDYKNKVVDATTPIPGLLVSNFSQIFPEDRGVNYAIREGEKISEICDRYVTSL